MPGEGLGGIAATAEHVIVSGRNTLDTSDDFRCFELKTGKQLWSYRYPALGKLDYGNSPRATPQIHKGYVYLQGAFGHLASVELKSGKLRWRQDFKLEYGTKLPTWGISTSPLVSIDTLIVQPGSELAGLVSLSLKTGEPKWVTAGRETAYSSPILRVNGKHKQVITYDHVSLGGWDLITGKKLWELRPPVTGDFNVPTPLLYKKKLVVSTENNGTRMYGFDSKNRLIPKPEAIYEELAPDSHTPVILSDRLVGISSGLHCLDLKNNLKQLWLSEDKAFHDYGSLIASEDRLLVTTTEGKVILIDVTQNNYHPLGSWNLIQTDGEIHSHPAIVKDRFLARVGSKLVCYSLS